MLMPIAKKAINANAEGWGQNNLQLSKSVENALIVLGSINGSDNNMVNKMPRHYCDKTQK